MCLNRIIIAQNLKINVIKITKGKMINFECAYIFYQYLKWIINVYQCNEMSKINSWNHIYSYSCIYIYNCSHTFIQVAQKYYLTAYNFL